MGFAQRLSLCGSLLLVCLCAAKTFAQTTPAPAQPQLVLLDTDIGDDIDDAFALALLLRSPEVKLLGITTAYGQTELRARLLDRYLAAAGRPDIPVAVGVPTPHSNVFTQAAYAQQAPDRKHPDGVEFLLDQIKAHPGQVTLLCIGPLSNIGAAIARDPATFRKVQRVVMMGGSILRGYGEDKSGAPRPPEPEWNIDRDPAGAQALVGSGVPIYMAPLDSTQIHLDTANRERIFSAGTPLTDQLTLLYHQWMAGTDEHTAAPTIYDPVAAASILHPELCPMTDLHIEVDGKGNTRPTPGAPNVHACLESDQHGFLGLLLNRIAPAH